MRTQQKWYNHILHSAQAMPLKGAFTLERVQGFAAVAADRARARLAEDGTPHVDHLSCEYRGVSTEDGTYDITQRPAWRSTLVYAWQATSCGHLETTLVQVRCGHAADQGVPFPKNWPTALRCSNLNAIADEAAKAARDELGRDTDCTLLGVAKRTTPPEPGVHEPGGTVILSGEGSRMAHLLCAKVVGDTWLCHRGSFQDGALNTSLPLSEHDLVGVTLD